MVQTGRLRRTEPRAVRGTRPSAASRQRSAGSNLPWLVVAISLFTSGAAAQEPEVVVQFEKEKVYEGESVRYQVFLNHCDSDAQPILTGFDDFAVQLVGTTTLNSRSTVSINGRTQRVIRDGPVYEYRLTPKRTGTITIPAPAVEIDGRKHEGRSLTLTVVPAPDQDVALLEMSVSREVVYPMQPFDVRLKIAVKPPPAPRDEADPVTVQDPPAQLSIPWADDSQSADGLRPKVPAARWLDTMLNRDGGFSVNGRPAERSLFGGFFNGRLNERSAYHPGAKRVLRKDAQDRRIEYWEYVFERTLFSEKVGDFDLGPASLKGVFATRATTRGRLEGQPVYAFAKALRVRVKDVPTEGRPESYTGAVGTFTFRSEISPREAKVGDPLTLTLSLTGIGTLDRTLAPDLSQQEEITARFKVYDATEETADSTRRFTYSLRPKHAEVMELPPIRISYFDVDDEEFVTLKTDAIPITVDEANRLSSADIAMATPQRSQGSSGLEVSTEGLFANVTDLGELRDETVHPDRWFLGLGGLAGLFFVVVVVTQRVQTLRADTGLQRRRGAIGAAKERLKAATQALGAGNDREGIELLSSTLLDFVADVSDLERRGQTAQDAITRLQAVGIESELIDRFAEVMQECDGARYGAGLGSTGDLVASAQSCLDDLVRSMKSRRLLS